MVWQIEQVVHTTVRLKFLAVVNTDKNGKREDGFARCSQSTLS